MFFINARFLGFFTNEEVQDLIQERTMKIGIFQNQANGRILLGLGLCLDESKESKETVQFIIGLTEKDRYFFPRLFFEIFSQVLPVVVKQILTMNEASMSDHDRMLKEYLFLYLDKICPSNLENAIKEFSIDLQKKIEIFFFRLSKRESSAQILYGIKEAPTFFAYIRADFLENESAIKTMVFKKHQNINSIDMLREALREILTNTILFYIKVVLDLSVVDKK